MAVNNYPFVGREDVLGELRAELGRAAAGRGGLVTLTGAAGVGKTRTAEEAAEQAGAFRTLWAWCPPETAGRAFRPWSRLLRELVADDVRCGRLVTASPPLRALVSGSAAGVLRGADPEAARLRLAGDVAELLATAAGRRPLLLVLDDVQAADASSLRLLLETVDMARTAPVLLLATARDDDAAWHDRTWARAQLLRRGRSLPLGPLEEQDVAVLVAAATGEDPGEEAVEDLVRRTGGDAFFVTELLRARSWDAAPRDGISSVAVRVAVQARVAQLTPRAARVLDVAAVLGTRFRLDVLAEAAEVPLGEVRVLLGEAAGAGLLGEVGADRGGFRHDLLRDAVYGALSPGARTNLHRAAADVLAGYARRGRDTGPAEVAHHLLLTGPENAREAAAYAREAAVRAEELCAFEDAARWYERAVEGLDGGVGGLREHRGADSEPSVETVEVLLGLGSARLGAGEWDGARAALLRAAGLARQVRRPDLLARAALGLGTGPVGFEVDLEDRVQLDLLTEARTALAEDPAHAALRAAVTARLSLAAGLVEPEKHRVALAEEAVRTAREVADPATLGPALAALCDARPGPGHCRDRLAWSAEIVAVARALPDPALELLGRRLRSVALMETGAFAEADAEALAYETAVRPLRRPLYAWYVPLWRGARALMEGRYDDCATALDEAEALGHAAGSANAALLVGTQRWCLYAETGDLDALERLLASMPPLDRLPGLWAKVSLALVAAQFGRLDEAARRLSAVAPRLAGQPRDSEWLPMVAQAAETVGALGSHPCAPILHDLLAPYAGLFVVEGIGAAVRGPVDRHLALLAAAMGDGERAREHRERALRAAHAAGAVALAERIAGETPGAPAERIAGETPGMPAERIEGEMPGTSAGGAAPSRVSSAPTASGRASPAVEDGERTAWPPSRKADGAAADVRAVAREAPGTGGARAAGRVVSGGSAVPGAGVARAGGADGAPVDAQTAPGIGAAVGAPPDGAVRSAVDGPAEPEPGIRVSAKPEPGISVSEEPEPGAGVSGVSANAVSPPAGPATDQAPLFRCEGPLWHLRYAGREVRLPDSKGLRDIAVLLGRPGTPVPAVELAAASAAGEHVEGLHPQGDTGDVIDATARAAYRRRLRELEEEAEEADAAADAARSERIAVERDALVGQLSAAYGIGGRVRRTGSPAERARTTVTARIRAAMRRIAAAHPELGRHLETALRTGTLCVYRPEQPPAWRL
jgi:tetratricopeptide (TPR) repeat protein